MAYIPPPSNAVNFVLGGAYTPPASNAVNFELGLEAGPGAHYEMVLVGRFALRAAVAVKSISEATVSGRFGMRGSLQASYDNSVWRGVGSSHGAQWDEGADNQSEHRSGWQAAQPQAAGKALSWEEATSRPIVTDLGWGLARSKSVDNALVWDSAIHAPHQTQTPWGKARSTPIERATPWQTAPTPKAIRLSMPYVYGTPRHIKRDLLWDNASKPLGKSWRSRFDQRAQVRNLDRVAPWDQAHPVASWGSFWVRPTTPVTPYEPPSRDLVLGCRFDATGGVHLILGGGPCSVIVVTPPAAPFYILAARYYMTTHTVVAHRLPDLVEIPIFEATVSSDVGSFCWTFSASGPESLFSLLAPSGGLPAQVRITLDGIPFVFAVEQIGRAGSFGKRGVSIGGRSTTALVGEPRNRAISRNNVGDYTAQQLAAAALDMTGVALDWGITDWLVTDGAWSRTGTALDAVLTIAQAAGGYLNSHRSAPTLLVRHFYGERAGAVSGAPWDWSTGSADVELAPDAIINDGADHRDGPDINAVYVSGTTQGVLAWVKRAGSAGDKLAQMVTDPLITHVDAARQRGLAILGNAGAKHDVRIELPVLTGPSQPGVLDVGQLVQINDTVPWRGRVRAVSVRAGLPSLRQSITLERHL